MKPAASHRESLLQQMPFYRGRPLETIDSRYLRFILRMKDISPELRLELYRVVTEREDSQRYQGECDQ